MQPAVRALILSAPEVPQPARRESVFYHLQVGPWRGPRTPVALDCQAAVLVSPELPQGAVGRGTPHRVTSDTLHSPLLASDQACACSRPSPTWRSPSSRLSSPLASGMPSKTTMASPSTWLSTKMRRSSSPVCRCAGAHAGAGSSIAGSLPTRSACLCLTGAPASWPSGQSESHAESGQARSGAWFLLVSVLKAASSMSQQPRLRPGLCRTRWTST